MSVRNSHLSVSMVKKILIVGCGVTGAATASLLQKRDPNKFKVTVFEKSRGTGKANKGIHCYVYLRYFLLLF
jgi:2-polyprenyl-6-methoxyphenol hydroxylase-like FAD-dependent oxidoreductase